MPGPVLPTFPRFDGFAELLLAKLASDGYREIGERLPLAGAELEMMRFRGACRVDGGKTWVVCVVRADGFKRDQVRYLSDQYYNALALERNALADNPTKIRGVCLFTFEAAAPKSEVDFLLGQSRPGTLFAQIQSAPWVLELTGPTLRKPRRAATPFADGYILDCLRG